jgi:hypothetical protein
LSGDHAPSGAGGEFSAKVKTENAGPEVGGQYLASELGCQDEGICRGVFVAAFILLAAEKRMVRPCRGRASHLSPNYFFLIGLMQGADLPIPYTHSQV